MLGSQWLDGVMEEWVDKGALLAGIAAIGTSMARDEDEDDDFEDDDEEDDDDDLEDDDDDLEDDEDEDLEEFDEEEFDDEDRPTRRGGP